MPARHIEYLRVDQIVPAATNPKKHALDGIGDSMARFGYTEPVVMDERTGRLIAGHGRIESLAVRHARGEAAPEGIEVDGDGGWMLPVVRGWASSSDSAAAAALVASNKLVEAGGWDEEMLAELLGDYRSDPDWLTGTGYGEEEVVEFLARLHPDEPVALGDPDDVPEAPAEPVTRAGDIWLLGTHRVCCGDATNADAVALLLGGAVPGLTLTDPPYGINAVGDNGQVGNHVSTAAPRFHARPIIGDDRPFDPAHLIALPGKHVLWGANHYADRLPPEGRWLVWDKKDGAFEGSGQGDAELAWTDLGGAVRLLHHTWQGMYRAGEGERSPRVHPTQKPVDLMAWCMDQAGEPLVLDPYAGSGSTLIAAHKTGRTALLGEIDAAYVDTICRRWQAFTNVVPILESTGEPHDFLSGEDTQPAP